MLICFPVISFICFLLFYRSRYFSIGWREGYILAAVSLAVPAVIFIEIASLFSAVTFFSVVVFWFFMSFLAAGFLWRSGPQKLASLFVFPRLGVFGFVCAGAVVLIVLANALVAFAFPPNNWDSMTYHLPRVMHWAMNAGVWFYPTEIERQLVYQPGAEFLLLHGFLLTGDDRWFNFLQWAGFIGCILSVSLVARCLGASLRGQALAALFVATLPMAILQSNSTQNDLVVSFWIIAFVALGLMLQRQFSRPVLYAAAAALGLSILTKGTFFVALPFAVFLVAALWKKGARELFVGLGIVLVLVAGHYSRCWAWQEGRSLVSDEQSRLMMKRHDPAAIMVNAMDQVASECMISLAPVNGAIERAAHKGAAFLGVDDQGLFREPFKAPPYPNLVFDEDFASNPFHVVLMFFVLLFFWKLKPEKGVAAYLISVMAACCLFIFFVKWQPYITRLHLPLFILLAPLAGLFLERWKWLAVAAGVVLFTAAWWVMFSHQTRPLGNVDHRGVPRPAYYFMKRPYRFLTYVQAMDVILSSKCRDAGLLQGGDSWEYPLWVLTGYGTVRFHNLDLSPVEGVSPCMAVTLDVPRERVFISQGETYRLIWQKPPLQIFARDLPRAIKGGRK